MIASIVILTILLGSIAIIVSDRCERKKRIEESKIFGSTHYPDTSILAAKVVEILSEEIGISVNQCEPNSRLLEDFGMDDEVEWICLQQSLNEEFSLDLPIELFIYISTIDDLVNMIRAT